MPSCVFCDPEKIEPRTIASFDGVNIVATLGQITEGGYILLIPANHVPCVGAMDEVQIATVDRVSREIAYCLKQKYRSAVTIFEHGIVGQTINHAHIHFFPDDVDLAYRIQSDFPESEIQTLNNLVELQQLYQERRQPYLLCSAQFGKFMVCWNPPAQSQYLRIVTAEALSVPERADWKKMDPDLDNALIDETIRILKPCFR